MLFLCILAEGIKALGCYCFVFLGGHFVPFFTEFVLFKSEDFAPFVIISFFWKAVYKGCRLVGNQPCNRIVADIVKHSSLEVCRSTYFDVTLVTSSCGDKVNTRYAVTLVNGGLNVHKSLIFVHTKQLPSFCCGRRVPPLLAFRLLRQEYQRSRRHAFLLFFLPLWYQSKPR